MFMWRLAKQSLPTNALRFKRNMAETDRCEFCGAQDSWRHALVDCNMSRSVWALADEEVTGSEERSAREWIAIIIATLKHDDQTRVFVTLWAIWHARRKA
jgi:hypothetical protein